MKKNLNLINAQCTQQDGVLENQWQVISSKGELLELLNNTLTPEEAMSYVHFARKYELDGYELGYSYAVENSKREIEKIESNSSNIIKNLIIENERLSEILESKFEN